jgi:hypothetical protein
MNNYRKAWAYSYPQFLLAPAGIAVQLHHTPLHGCDLARQVCQRRLSVPNRNPTLSRGRRQLFRVVGHLPACAASRRPAPV